jgi:DNA-binding NarL/FixJ family response regulator
MTGMKTVVIVEDQTAVREMIAHIVDSDPTFSVIAQSGEGKEAMEICLRQQPDLIILDIMLPGLNGTELMRQIARDLPNSRALVFSGYQTPQLVREMMLAGAHGFVEKTAPLSEVKKGIQTVAGGGSYFGPEVAKIVRETMLDPHKPLGPSLSDITPREREILRLIAKGYTSKDISAELNLSIKTTENHRTNLMRKLKLHNAAALTRFAIEQGMADPSSAEH